MRDHHALNFGAATVHRPREPAIPNARGQARHRIIAEEKTRRAAPEHATRMQFLRGLKDMEGAGVGHQHGRTDEGRHRYTVCGRRRRRRYRVAASWLIGW